MQKNLHSGTEYSGWLRHLIVCKVSSDVPQGFDTATNHMSLSMSYKLRMNCLILVFAKDVKLIFIKCNSTRSMILHITSVK